MSFIFVFKFGKYIARMVLECHLLLVLDPVKSTVAYIFICFFLNMFILKKYKINIKINYFNIFLKNTLHQYQTHIE
jgi:hypothetical protein